MSALATELSSENVTLTTYYPAPSGVYNQMITTQATYLARDSGNVGVGTTNPTAKTHIVGIDALDSAYSFKALGSAGAGLTVSNAGNTANSGALSVGGVLAANGGLSISGSTNSFVNGKLQVGAITFPATPLGDIDVSGTGLIVSRQGTVAANSCTYPAQAVDYKQGTTACVGASYATLTVGFMTKYTSMGPAPIWAAGDVGKILGQFFCCPCPAAGCPQL